MRPDPAGSPELRNFLEEIRLRYEIERQPVCERVDRNTRLDHFFHISDAVGQRERHLLYRCRSSFGNVIATDVDRIVARHVTGAEHDDIARNPQRWPDGEYPFFLRDIFFEDISLNRSGNFLQIK